MYRLPRDPSQVAGGPWQPTSAQMPTPSVVFSQRLASRSTPTSSSTRASTPLSKEGLHLLACQDLLHLLWRWRRQLLDPKRTLQMGKYHACRAHLTSVPGLNRQDLDFKEKQHWPGVLRIFSKATIDYLTQKVMQDKHDEKRATLAYVWAGYKLRNA